MQAFRIVALALVLLAVSVMVFISLGSPSLNISDLSLKRQSFADAPAESAPVAALAYQTDSPRAWEDHFHLRNKQLARSNQPEIASISAMNLKTVFQMYWEPTFSCKYPVRVGRVGDGGKWVCNPHGLLESAKTGGRKVIVYSLGSNGDYSFETGINEIFGDQATIDTFDMGHFEGAPKFLTLHQNKVVGVDENGNYDKTENGISVNAMREQLGHVGKPIDIFKIDIEGSEYEVLKTYIGPGCPLNANMILMETHGDTPAHYSEIFEKLQKNCQMELYMKEPNIQFSGGEVLEWCFVRVDWAKRPLMPNELSWHLAYQVDTAKGWRTRFDNRNKQMARSNKPNLKQLPDIKLKEFFQRFWEPTFSCDFAVRIGRIGDGGKWVCNPYQIRQAAEWENRKVIVYSLGSNGDYSFETGINEIFGEHATIDTFDMGHFEGAPRFLTLHQNKIVGVDAKGNYDKTENGISVNAIREKLGHVGKPIDIFKIDIEGSEYEVLKTYIGPGCPLNANMIMMETHWDTPAHYSEIFQKLQDNCGMELYYKEPNIQFSNGEVLEWCWVRVDWKSRPGL
ncbi:MAG: hypothetical protein SGCHY_003444 [Lobulomycetales sp.]